MDWRWLAWQIYDPEIWRSTALAYDQLLQSQWLTPGQLEQLRAQRLEETLHFAVSAVPYYRNLYLSPKLEAFPVITRAMLRRHAEELLAPHQNEGRITRWNTGGSTGEPVTVYVDAAAQALRRAALLRGDLWGTSLRPTDPQAGLWASARDSGKVRGIKAKLFDRLFNRYIFNCFEMNEARATELNKHFAWTRSRLLYGPTTAIQAFMHFGRRAGISPWRFEKVVPCGEQCSLEDSSRMEEFFGCSVADRYASNEMGLIASRCEHKTWHLSSELILLEVQREDGSISTEGRGRLLCTSLISRAMPLIRYEIGDIVDLTPVDCSCGRGLQTFCSMEGRVSDLIKCSDGRWINLCTFNSFFQHLPLVKYRFIIEDEGRMTFLMQSERELLASELEPIREHFRQVLGADFSFEMQQVETIPVLPSGKSPYVVNRLHSRLVNAG